MSVEIATAYISLVPSASGITQHLHDELDGPITKEGKRSGNALSGALTGAATRGLQVGAGAVAAGFGASLVKGFGRLRAIDDARFKLQGLGHDAGTVDAIMDNALGAVLGTSFGLEEAATIAASAVAAGIRPGQDLERTLSLTGDAATIAGTSLEDMGAIFGVVASMNRLSGVELMRLGRQGIPILEWLQDEYGITSDEASAMVSRGEVDFATFQTLMENNIGGAALTAGGSFSGAFSLMGSALGRFGAALLGPAFAAAPEIFGRITAGLDAMAPAASAVAAFVAENSTAFGILAAVLAVAVAPVFLGVIGHWVALGAAAVVNGAIHVVQSWRTVAGFVAQGVAALGNLPFVIRYYTTLAAQAVRGAAVHVAQAGRAVAAWVLMGVQALLAAAKVAIAWLISIGPIALVIAAVVGLVVLIVKNWDTIVAATTNLWNRVVSIFTSLRDSVVSTITNLMDRVRSIKDTVIGFFANAGTWLLDAGRNIIRGLIDGITGMIGNIGSAMGKVASKIRNFLPFSPAKEGPLSGSGSPVLAGSKIVEMLASGMTTNLGQLAAAADAAARAAMPPVGSITVPRAPGIGTVGFAGASDLAGGDTELVGMLRELVRLTRDGRVIMLDGQAISEVVDYNLATR